MSCPTADELDSLLAPGVPADPARATAVLAHTRECPRCRERLAADSPEPSRPTGSRERAARRPRLSIVAIGATGLALVAASRTCGRRTETRGTAPVTSAR